MKSRIETPVVSEGGEELQWNALLGQQDLLREEIKRGKECLARAQAELAEYQSQLEEWPTYEQRCGTNCLPHLTESLSENQRVERFLAGWLQRREEQLVAVEQAIVHLGTQTGLRVQAAA